MRPFSDFPVQGLRFDLIALSCLQCYETVGLGLPAGRKPVPVIYLCSSVQNSWEKENKGYLQM